MKISEKIIQLRKKNNWSQEALANELNVSRQTVSKWEIGQTVPDTSNLTKIAKVFQISVNDLLEDTSDLSEEKNETSKDKTNNDNIQSKKNRIIILILSITLVLAILGIAAISINKLFNKATNQTEPKSIIEMFQENSLSDIFDSIFKQVGEIGGFKANDFNHTFKLQYYGGKDGAFMDDFIDEVIKSNEENPNHIITVVFSGVLTNNATKLRNMKEKFVSGTIYEISYDYDKNGYINKAIIEKGKLTEFAKSSFNSKFENLYFGGQTGFFVKNLIDEVIKSNEKYPDHVIVVAFDGIETNDSTKLRSFKGKFANFTTYEISYGYDEDGLINKVNIER